jgi:exosortase A-associated hydrolase 2
LHPFFLQGQNGQRFCIFHAPECNPRGAVIYFHPFAEEMNKSRRMAALQARALAEAGYAVLQIDLCGCGDSEGDFADATWEAWLEDATLAYRWLREQTDAPLYLWGLRAGCLLAASFSERLQEQVSFVFWQPVTSGKQHWQQFARLKLAGEIAAGGGKEVMDLLKRQLESGLVVEIAGYSVSPHLVEGLQGSELLPKGTVGKVFWLESSSREDGTLAPVSLRYIEQWQAAGWWLDAKVVRGPAFWQTVEIEDSPALIETTLAAIGMAA